MNGVQQEELNRQLFEAILRGSVEQISKLIKDGTDVDRGNSKRRTPLHIAAYHGYTDEIKLLIENGADVNREDGEGDTPLHKAFRCRHRRTVRQLLENGADVNRENNGRQVASYDKIGMLDVLMDYIDTMWHVVGHIVKLEAVNLYVSGKNLQGKNEFVSSLDEEPGNYYSHYVQNCKEEAKKIKEENKPLYDFLRESNGDSLVSIWERNEDSLVSRLERSEDVSSKFNDKESLRAQYPEYTNILVNKAKKVKKEIFLHNNKPLIDALPQLGYHGGSVPDKVRTFLEENRARFKVNLGNPKKSLIDFVDFEDTATLHVPKLKLCAAVSEVVKNNALSTSLDNPNAEQLLVPALMYS